MKNKEMLKTEYSAVALGNFDGLHIAHRAVLKNACSYAVENGVKAEALVFDVHPKNFQEKKVGLLMSSEDKKSEIEKIGLETFVISFEEIRSFSAEKFVREILKKRLKAKAVFCGYNYHFGVGGKADVNVLKTLCEKNGIELFVCDKVEDGQNAVSSSRLRELLALGKVDEANRLMQRDFSYALEVVHGQKRGRELGFPTINQYFPADLVVPKFGVYASSVIIDGKTYRSFTNIGFRPTFPEDDVRSETHIFGYEGDLYGKKVRVCLHKYLREEIKFSSLESLTTQLSQDKKSTDEFFNRQK